MGKLYTSSKDAAICLHRELIHAFPGVEFHVFAERSGSGSICITVEYPQYNALLEEVKAVAVPFVNDIFVPVEQIFADEAIFIEPKHVVTGAGKLINQAEQHTLVCRTI